MAQEIICLDTSIFIDYFRRKDKEKTTFFGLTSKGYKLATTTITVFEIYQGSTESQNAFWETLFDRLIIFPFDEESARVAASISQKQFRKNKRIEKPDLFIAAIALLNNLPVSTLNIRDFAKVDGLKILSIS